MKSKWILISTLVIAIAMLSTGAFAIASDSESSVSDASSINAGQQFVIDMNAFFEESTHNPDIVHATYADGLIIVTVDPSQNTDNLILSVSDLIDTLDGYTITLDGKTVISNGSIQRTGDTIDVIQNLVEQTNTMIDDASSSGVYTFYTDSMTIQKEDIATGFSGTLRLSVNLDTTTITMLKDFTDIISVGVMGDGLSITINMTEGMVDAVGTQNQLNNMTILELINALSNVSATDMFGVDIGAKVDGVSNGLLGINPSSLNSDISGITYSWEVNTTTYTLSMNSVFNVSTTGTGLVQLLNSIVSNVNSSSNGWSGVQIGTMRSGNVYNFDGSIHLTYTSGGSASTLSLPLVISVVYPQHNVTYNVNGGSASAPTQTPVTEGSTFTLAYYSGTKTGFTFGGWNDGTTTHSAGYTYTMGSSNVTFTAVWISDASCTITSSAGAGGSISPSGAKTVNYGSNQTYIIISSDNYVVSDVIVDGSSVGAVNSYTFTNVTGNHTINAIFKYSEGTKTWTDPSTGYIYQETKTTVGDTDCMVLVSTSPSGDKSITATYANDVLGIDTVVAADGSFNVNTHTAAVSSGKVDQAVMTDDQLNEILKQIDLAESSTGAENPTINVVVTGSGSSDVESTSLTLTGDLLTTIGDLGIPMNINTETGNLNLDSDVIKKLSTYGGDLAIAIGTVENSELNDNQRKIVGDRTVISANVSSGTTIIHDLGGNVTVTMPYELKDGEKSSDIVIWYLDDNGNVTEIHAAYNEDTKTVSFTTDHFSYYVIAFGSPSQGSSDYTWLYVAIAIIAIAMICIVAYYIRTKRNA